MNIISWPVSSHQRLYPVSRGVQQNALTLPDIALNERFSFQIAVRNNGPTPVQIHASSQAHPSLDIRIRRVGYIPVQHLNTDLPSGSLDVEGRAHIPGWVPDPLFEECALLLPPSETHSFWFTVTPTSSAVAGEWTLPLTIQPEGGEAIHHSVRVYAHPIILEQPRFSITHWFYPDAIMDWYRTDGLDEAFWKLLPAYLRNMREHGIDTLYVPHFTPPLDGVKRPVQLLRISKADNGDYRFDWSLVKRYIKEARECGFERFEWGHLFTQWGARHAIRIYEGHGEDEKLLWAPDTEADSPIYRHFLCGFLPHFHEFLKENNLLEGSLFHLSDEPHGEECVASYSKAKATIHDLAPWMHPIMDAVSELRFAKEGLVELPASSVSTALDFVKEGIEAWCYYCCIPRGRFINRLMDTPLPKIAMHGLLFYRWPFKGFLHWGYNYWYQSQTRKLIDPYQVQDALQWPLWAYGDPFVVYPGPEGPLDSIRWEIFSESLQDYALLQTLKINRSDSLLSEIRSFEKFPKNTAWRKDLRKRLFEQSK